MRRLSEILTATAAVMILVANIIAAKIISIPIPFVGEIQASAGVVPIAVVFLCTDIISEEYGPQVARHAVFTITGLLVVSWCVLQWSVLAPHAGGVPQQAYATAISSTTPLFLASVTSVFVTQLLDVQLFHYLARLTDDTERWVRNIGSTAVSQLADITLFTVLAFVVFPSVLGTGALSWEIVASVIVVEYGVRFVLALVDTPLFYALTQPTQPSINTDV